MSTLSLSFRFSGKIARLLGRESVSSETVALFELVKNSYDADATKVELTFENVTQPGGKIRIEDNGTGMTLADFKDRWMVVGTETKERNRLSNKGRRVAGEKGIGRFATEKLAKKITITSNPENEKERIVLNLNWREYEKEGVLFDQINNPVAIGPKRNEKDHGLEIVLEDLVDKWTGNMISHLKKEIGTLILPKDLADSKQDFSVILTAHEFDIRNKQVESTILQMAPYRMIATTVNNVLHCVIYEKKKRHERDAHRFKKREPRCGPITFHLYIFPQDAPNEYGWTKYYENNLAGVEIDEFLKEYCGVRIYRDGFWIKPYGGTGDDWLELDKMRVSRYTNIGNSQVVGIIKISADKNQEIKDTTTRERLIENDAFRDMKEIVVQAVKEFNMFRNEMRKEHQETESKTPKQTIAVNNIDQAKKMVEKLSIEDPEKKEIISTLKSAKSNVKEYVVSMTGEVTEKDTALISQKSLVTIGLATTYIAHEVIRPLDDNIRILNRLDSLSENDVSGIKKLKADLEQLKFNMAKLLHYMDFVEEYASLVSRSIHDRWQSTDVCISKEWGRIAGAFKEVVEGLGISVVYRGIPDNITISINAIDLESVLTNLLTNSIRSLSNIQDKRMIKIEATFQGDRFVLKFSDNGPGIDSENRERIFEPLFSTYRTRGGKSQGTGLGLPIVKEVLQRYDGTIELVQNGEFERGATFLIQIPLSRAPCVVL